MTPPVQQPAAPARPRRWYHSPPVIIFGTMAIGMVLLIGLALLFAAFPQSSGGDGVRGPEADVTMTSCVGTSYGSPKAILSVHNSTSHRTDYRITVVFEHNGVQLGSGFATVFDLNPGQTAMADAVGFGVDTSGSLSCRVSDVRRRYHPPAPPCRGSDRGALYLCWVLRTPR